MATCYKHEPTGMVTCIPTDMVTCIRPVKDQGNQKSSMDEEGLTRPKLEEGKAPFSSRMW